MELNVFQGEAPLVRDNVKIGTLSVPVPVNRNANEAVDVRFTYDTSGVLEVIATVVTNGKAHRLVIEGNPGALSQKDILQRLAELERIKIHPREEAFNAALVARITKAFENALGPQRKMLSAWLGEFEAILARQHPKEIAAVRSQITGKLEALEKYDVY